VEVVRISNFDNPKIESFLIRQKFLPVQQTSIWAKFQKNLGINSLRLVVFDNEKVVAFAQIFIKKLLFGLTKIEIPRAPLGDPNFFLLLLSEIEQVACERKAIFARFDFQKNLLFDSPKFRKADEKNFPLATIRIDLKKSVDEIFAVMKSKGRYNIRVAEKHGVVIFAEKSIDDFFALLQKTTIRDGFVGHSKSFYEKFVEVLGENCVLLVARQNSKPLAATLVTLVGDTATYYFGASDHEFRNLMASYLIQFEAIKIAQKRGCRFYDFLGVVPEGAKNHRLAGVSDFKKKFGGEFVEYPIPKIIIFRPIFYALFRLVKFLRF